jgi:L-asparaginase II
MTTTHPDLVHLLRGSTVESFHRGALAIVDADGRLVQALGDVTRPAGLPASAFSGRR